MQTRVDDVYLKIDAVDRFAVEGFQFAKEERARDRVRNQEDLNAYKEEFMKTLMKEIDGMKDHVQMETSRGETHR